MSLPSSLATYDPSARDDAGTSPDEWGGKRYSAATFVRRRAVPLHPIRAHRCCLLREARPELTPTKRTENLYAAFRKFSFNRTVGSVILLPTE